MKKLLKNYAVFAALVLALVVGMASCKNDSGPNEMGRYNVYIDNILYGEMIVYDDNTFKFDDKKDNYVSKGKYSLTSSTTGKFTANDGATGTFTINGNDMTLVFITYPPNWS